MEFWQNIYTNFDPVAFSISSVSVHWYGIMYATALLSAIFVAKELIKRDNINIKEAVFDSYIWWVEIGVILGARIGYVLFYDTQTSYYLSHPWQIFNPFVNGEFTGISGMSYHGAVIGFAIASYLFCRKNKLSMLFLADISVVGISFGYTFGRIGNFLNQELIGRTTDLPWGIYVGDSLRHPSALYEAFLEGFVIFVILFMYRNKTKFTGQLFLMYGFLYSLMRIIAEMYREPDIQLGFLFNTSWLTMGMLISFIFASICLMIILKVKKQKA
ncbi:MAG: prolipoprotein diacylglyceryl transferase [Campylobacteraceae bacterium]|nr:prolipoprotein diacylglyceryl transferase [Campylobacteraceae bacterium]